MNNLLSCSVEQAVMGGWGWSRVELMVTESYCMKYLKPCRVGGDA